VFDLNVDPISYASKGSRECNGNIIGDVFCIFCGKCFYDCKFVPYAGNAIPILFLYSLECEFCKSKSLYRIENIHKFLHLFVNTEIPLYCDEQINFDEL